MPRARSLSPALIPALLSLSRSVDPSQTAAFPGALAVCIQHDMALLCSLPSALQTSLFLPFSRCLVYKSLPAQGASAQPRLCSGSASRRSPSPLGFPGDWLALGFAPPGLMRIACVFFCLFHIICPFLLLSTSTPSPLCYLLQFGLLTFCWVLFFLASHLWGFHSHHFNPNLHRHHSVSSFSPARFFFGASAISAFPDMV